MYYVKNVSLVFMLIGLSYCQTGIEHEEELTANKKQNKRSVHSNLIQIYGNTVRFPFSVWQEKEFNNHKTIFNTFRDEKNGFFIFEFIPTNETFEAWTKIYAIEGYHLGKQDLTVLDIANMSKLSFKRGCTVYHSALHKFIDKEKKSIINMHVCEQIKGTNTGEIYLGYFTISRGVVINVYHEWKGKPLKNNDPSTWPVSQREIDIMKKRLNSIDIYPAGNIQQSTLK